MSFNISKFKARMDRMGGPGRTNLFEVRMSQPLWVAKLNPEEKVSDFTARDFSLFCSDVTFPGVDINMGAMDYVGQLTRSIPTSVTNPGPITCKFYCDSDHNTVRFFHRWMREVMNFSSQGGYHSEFGGKLKGEAGFKDNYACDLEILHYSTQSDPGVYYAANLLRAFPTKVSPVALSWASTEPATITVDFSFDDYHFSDDKAGNTGARSTRGAGLLDLLGDIAGFADTVRGTIKAGRPRSIQDAVNRLQRLGNALDNVSDNFPNTDGTGN
jgi:hypothetical protein